LPATALSQIDYSCPDRTILQGPAERSFLLQEKFLLEKALNIAESCRKFAGSCKKRSFLNQPAKDWLWARAWFTEIVL